MWQESRGRGGYVDEEKQGKETAEAGVKLDQQPYFVGTSSGQLFVHSCNQPDQLLYNYSTWFLSSLWEGVNGYNESYKAGYKQLSYIEMCVCVSACPHTSLGLHVVQCHLVDFRDLLSMSHAAFESKTIVNWNLQPTPRKKKKHTHKKRTKKKNNNLWSQRPAVLAKRLYQL